MHAEKIRLLIILRGNKIFDPVSDVFFNNTSFRSLDYSNSCDLRTFGLMHFAVALYRT